jgi:hypothetical protein
MFSFITSLNPKAYLIAALLLFIVSTVGYINNLKSNIEEKETELKSTSLKLDEANKNNELIIQAYEKTLATEREIATQKAITQEQKEVVVTKYKTLTKTIEKRGEIKQDEKSNFTIVTF